jgi:hypothetical protein
MGNDLLANRFRLGANPESIGANSGMTRGYVRISSKSECFAGCGPKVF